MWTLLRSHSKCLLAFSFSSFNLGTIANTTDKCSKTVFSGMYKTRVQSTNVYKALGSKHNHKSDFFGSNISSIFPL